MKKILLIAGIVFSVAFFLLLTPPEIKLFRATGYGAVALQFVPDGRRAVVLAGAWMGDLAEAARAALFADFGFMILGYGLTLVTLGLILKDRLLPFLAAVAVLADLVENSLHLAGLETGSAEYFSAAFPFSMLKYVLLASYSVIAVRIAFRKRKDGIRAR